MSCESLNRFFQMIPEFTSSHSNEEMAQNIIEQLLIFKNQCGPLIHQSLMHLKENYYEIWMLVMFKIGDQLS